MLMYFGLSQVKILPHIFTVGRQRGGVQTAGRAQPPDLNLAPIRLATTTAM